MLGVYLFMLALTPLMEVLRLGLALIPFRIPCLAVTKSPSTLLSSLLQLGPVPHGYPLFFPRSIGPFLWSVPKPTILAMGKLALIVSVCPAVAAPPYSAMSGFLFLVGLGAAHSCQYSVVVVVLDFVQLPA